MIRDRVSILIVAGEASGERHAAGLVEEVNRQNPDWEIQWFGSGGNQLAAAGVEILSHVSILAAIGPWEALSHMGNYWRLYRRILAEICRRKPLLAILVDFPEFNLRLARRLKRQSIPVCYFIGPQVWAWRPSRVDWIQRYVDLMLVIFPFEEEFYQLRGIKAHYVGNPLSALSRRGPARANNPPVVVLLPGSRKKEVENIFSVQLDAARYIANRQETLFWVVTAPTLTPEYLSGLYEKWIGQGNSPLPLQVRTGEAVQLLSQADCAIIKSGTSTLEAMMLEIPFAMVYRVSTPSWYLLHPLVNTDTYCLANLVAGKKIVPEFIQREATGETIGAYLLRLLRSRREREAMQEQLRVASRNLGKRNPYLESARLLQGQILKNQFES